MRIVKRLLALLAAIPLVLLLSFFKRDLYTAIYGSPFTKSEYKELIAEDRQTELGFRKEWKDSLESGQIRKTINSVAKTEKDRKLATKMFEDIMRADELSFRNIESKSLAIENQKKFSKFLRCSWLIGDENLSLSKEFNSLKKDPLVYVARMISSSNLRFMVLDIDNETTLDECYENYL